MSEGLRFKNEQLITNNANHYLHLLTQQMLSCDSLTSHMVWLHVTLRSIVCSNEACDVCAGIIPAGKPLCSSVQAPVEWDWMCKWLNGTECHGHCAASYLRKHTHAQRENKTPHKQA